MSVKKKMNDPVDKAYEEADQRNIGKNLATLRYLNNYSMENLAELVFISKGSIFMYEHGYRKPPKDKLQIFADFYNTPIEDFYLVPEDFGMAVMNAYNDKMRHSTEVKDL